MTTSSGATPAATRAGTATRADAAALPSLLGAISAERAHACVAALAGDDFTGRRVGTAGNAAARSWLAARLAELGAAAQVDEFPVRRVPQVYAVPSARWHSGDGRGAELVFGRDVAPHLTSADLPRARYGPVAVAGTGDPSGRWLLVPEGTNLFDAYRDAGDAAGLLVARAVDADGWQYTTLAGPDPGPLPVLALATSAHRALGHAVSAGGAWFTGDAPIRRVDVTGTNLYGRLRAVAAGRADILLTAHFDGVGDHPGLRQPAAADNASGVAVVLEAARVLTTALPAGTGLSVAFLDGEETGALGSAHHAARLRAAGATPWVVNVDGAGRLDDAAAVEAGGPAHRLLAVLDQAGRHTEVPLAAGPVASDNRRYAAAGLATVGIGAGMAGYHSPADTPERVEPATLAAIARLVTATVRLAADHLTRRPPVPAA
ncbi:M28 family peptidase [Micromonospora sp. NPDC049559]|uniref:M28 family peptidase n=1 Tax=Micromonospora sp. NPDC049559 TaxID=3155923 RepID=UPI00344446A5